MRHINSLLIALLIVTALGIAQPTLPARAATTITVTNPDDNITAGNGCSLREAIVNANNDAQTHPDCPAGTGNDTIVFSATLGTATFTLASALPVISDTDGLTINGVGDRITINGNNAFRVLEVGFGATLTLQNLTLANGSGVGGGVYNSGTLTILTSTFKNNDGLDPGAGGGIFNNSGTVTITNSTFAGNAATNGGAIYNNTGTVTITNATIFANSIWGAGTGIVYNNGIMTVKNTIIANGAGASVCAGNAFEPASTNNLTDDTTCGATFTQKTLLELALTPLANYGGSTPTFGLTTASAAFNAANGAACPTTDQRGVARPQGLQCDIGASELKISLTFTPPSIIFPSQLAGTTSALVNVIVTNSGEADVTIDVLSITGEFGLFHNTCDAQTLIPTATCSFDVNFTPLSGAAKIGSVSVPSTATTLPISFALSGTGAAAVQLLKVANFDTIVLPIPWRTLLPIRNLNSVRECFGYYLSPPCSVRLAGRPFSPSYTVQQLVSKTGAAGDKYYFGMSSRAEGIPPGGKYQVDIIFYSLYNQIIGSQSLYFTNGTHDFETLAAYYTVPAAYYRILFRFTLQKSGGKAWFDNAILVRAP
jgi:hypothetical protein